MKPEETIDFHIRWAWLRIAKMYNRMGASVGISQSMGLVLLSIDPKHGTPSTSLGPMMGMEPTSLSRTLKSMEDRQLIKRQADEADGRVTRICLTSEGEKLRETSKSVVVEFNNKLLKDVDQEKLMHFKEVIQMIDHHTMNQEI